MQKYRKSLRDYVFSILKDSQNAEEVTNETFLKAFNNRETIKCPEQLIGWLYKTAKHTAIDHKRTKQREGKYVYEFVSLDQEDSESITTASIQCLQNSRQNRLRRINIY